MWIIDNKQLDNISKSMRGEFERRAYYILSKEDYIKLFDEDKIKENISNQMDIIIQKGINDDNEAIEFIRMSFEVFFSKRRIGYIFGNWNKIYVFNNLKILNHGTYIQF